MSFPNLSSASARLFSRGRPASAKADRPAEAPLDVRDLARRTVPRDAVDFRAALTIESIGTLDARIMDISPYGFQSRAGISRLLERGERVCLMLPLAGECPADVMWGLKGLFGCKFVAPIELDLYQDLLARLRESGSSLPDED